MTISIRSERDISAIRRPHWSCVVGCARGQRCRKPTPSRNGKQVAAKAKCDRRAIRGNCGISEPERVDLRTEQCVFTGNGRCDKAEGKRDKDCEASNILRCL